MILAFALALLALALPAGERPAPPNLLLIIGDDVGTDCLAVYGDSAQPARTPALDGLAEAGLVFRRHWAAPVCSPSRATLLTGRHGSHSGIGWNIPFEADGQIIGTGGPAGLMWTEAFLPRVLRQAGYRTAAVGKWHLANTLTGAQQHPVLVGFEVHAGPIVQGGYFGWTKNIAGAGGNLQVEEPGYSTSVFVDDALTFLDAAGEQPWFLWLSFVAAHKPFHQPPLELLSAETQSELQAGTPSEPDLRRAMVEAMDTEIGRLLDALDPAVRANTLVVFMGDNGSPEDAIEQPVGFGGAKGSLFEGGIRVPLIVSGPGVAAPGRQIDALSCSVDVHATLVDLAGASLPLQATDGRSLRPLMQDPRAGPVRRFAYAERFDPNGLGPKSLMRRAIRDERFKLWQIIVPVETVPLRLYDMALDPLEANNLLAPGSPALDAIQQAALDKLLAQLAGF